MVGNGPEALRISLSACNSNSGGHGVPLDDAVSSRSNLATFREEEEGGQCHAAATAHEICAVVCPLLLLTVVVRAAPPRSQKEWHRRRLV